MSGKDFTQIKKSSNTYSRSSSISSRSCCESMGPRHVRCLHTYAEALPPTGFILRNSSHRRYSTLSSLPSARASTRPGISFPCTTPRSALVSSASAAPATNTWHTSNTHHIHPQFGTVPAQSEVTQTLKKSFKSKEHRNICHKTIESFPERH